MLLTRRLRQHSPLALASLPPLPLEPWTFTSSCLAQGPILAVTMVAEAWLACNARQSERFNHRTSHHMYVCTFVHSTQTGGT